jgi:TolB-like protein/DNA-binding SARP family transcriptional activator/Flp pilus assembly protein TadD
MDTASQQGSGTERPARWSLGLFGGFELGVLATGEKVAVPGKRERVLLATLALSLKGSQPRRKLATLLWGNGDDETALANLRTTIWRLRKALGDTEHRFVASDGEDIALDITAFEVDALAFRHLAAQSRPRELEFAANLYSGELLYGLDIENEEFESWRRSEAARYRERAVEVLTWLLQHYDESGGRERAIETGIRIMQLEPLNEACVRRLMRLYTASGRRGAAVQLYRTLADALRADLGAEPEAETRSAYADIARGGEEQADRGTNGEATPPPSVRKTPINALGSHVQAKPRLGRWIAASGLAALMALFLLYQILPRNSEGTGSPSAETVSVAVLPFVNLSGDDTQEFLSDGLTEEITTALAKVPGLRVVARTSAFQFKGQNRDIDAIARQLHASHIIEGSVRKAGDRLRITVQLIEASGGMHLWSESYERQLTDIFAIQEDIARTIVASLRVPLGLSPGENLVANRGIDPESFQQYLRARQLVRARTRGAAEAIAILEPLVERNPDFAPAWVQLAQAYGATVVRAGYNASAEELRRIRTEYNSKRAAAAGRAVELDPNSAEAYWAQAAAQTGPGEFQATEEILSKALALDPNNPDVLNAYSNLLRNVGRLKEALPIKQQVVALEPFVPVYTGNLGEALWLNGQNEAALAVLKSGPRGNNRAAEIASVYAAMGRFSEAADSILELPEGLYPPGLVAEASRLLRMAPTTVASPETLPRLATLGFIYPYLGASLRALEFVEEGAEGNIILFWHSSFAPVRKTERFKAILRKAGLVDYWRARGWPEFCHPTAGDDFACD